MGGTAHVEPETARRSRRAQVALSSTAVLMRPWLARQKDLDPDAHVVCGFAQALADWLEHYERPRPADDAVAVDAEQV